MSTRLGRPRSFDRDAALRAATEVFWENGYEATSVNDLTRALGITPPSLYAAFGSKSALFTEAVERYRATIGAGVMDAFRTASSARAGVEAMLRTAAVDYTDPAHPAGCLIISAAATCGPRSREVERYLRRLRNVNVDTIAERIRTDVENGTLPEDTDPGALASYYAAVLQGMSQRARDGADREELERTAELAMRAWPEGRGRRS
ncbi:TetR/AcrR family transcriptional regulator [Halostreptopolyspora alba]|uniref:TetR/AcrR family transcriptional regulator n=1 Tax=Halostreptopolyspora alba TaxID=2487137 RepID=A0A3N0EHP8_9ACTN|nr:TetR/AcrR family transcriptional regulator [Nocardiopsaceae bacterium YIM 96095]